MKRYKKVARVCNFCMAVVFGIAIYKANYVLALTMAFWVIVEELDHIVFAIREMREGEEK
jgi:hypothetical protein